MTAYLVRRLLWLPVLLLIISFVTFALGFYGPGDPVQVLMGLRARPEVVEQLRKDYGFDQPLIVQYFNYIGNALRGNFGYSIVKYPGQPVSELLAKRFPVSLQLNIVTIAWSLPLGIALGIVAALSRRSWVDVFIRALVILGVSLPIIGLQPILTFLLGRRQELFGLTIGPFLPVGGWKGMFAPEVILPSFLLGLGIVAVFTRQTRAALREAMTSDYVRTARAKGLREWMVILRHALRNALIPLFTLFGFMIIGLFAGSFIVESFFGIPGIGQLAYDSLTSREYYIIVAFTLIGATVYVLITLAVDILYVFVDPRIRYQKDS